MQDTTSHQGQFLVTCQHKLPKEERIEADGTTKEVHVVIKQSSFIVSISSESIILEGCNVDCSLVYDNDGLTEVHYINQKPISFTAQLSSPNRITCDVRILVLSSQHEDMLFKVIFKLTNKKGEQIATLHSFPIRVISKADGKKKVPNSKPPKLPSSIKPEQKSKILTQSHLPVSTPVIQSLSSPSQQNIEIQPAALQNANEQTEESVLQILQYQQSILRDLTQQTNVNPLSSPLVGLINSYQQLPQNQRIPQLLRIISSLSPQENALISELVSLIAGINTSVQTDPQQQIVQPFQTFAQPASAYQNNVQQQFNTSNNNVTNQFQQLPTPPITIPIPTSASNQINQQSVSSTSQPPLSDNTTSQPHFQTSSSHSFSPQHYSFNGNNDTSFYPDTSNN
ncbi:transcriptional regulator cudA, putative [Entamoeba histolytica HM-1:IMSS-B]|uniref:Transcriptional regulator cudA n=6 Tax=Entamoeba histolytica TaxID=5759 RepID=C4M3R4_ENTH1|nr:hypothetical protein EHI_052730 [Entamoeba histolytica HM-1:IMSS]EMD48401.1 transcriptional regulator cudA, putative [Entamoeba histolytica KU27]EMH76100.1 transcriptional regulator cudA, putative [Entamoeba histolytica HM-1:IMSS-B]EMS14197.1 transcriptional regulator cudA, putative [Entamoeba histolytica HM-3:IMSS]ENY61945.1 transcriptional regulator cudA, putative [Entamoeba histolytica HM-1:IMSS-A]GAT95973.1 hypothetical protein CL6EHI_052730 [Entamoeba histolytica]|eukprot:XP_651635.1 hypothetical protein EHI_052730 [Entamoeba histolytica HM-1:IMSS]